MSKKLKANDDNTPDEVLSDTQLLRRHTAASAEEAVQTVTSTPADEAVGHVYKGRTGVNLIADVFPQVPPLPEPVVTTVNPPVESPSSPIASRTQETVVGGPHSTDATRTVDLDGKPFVTAEELAKERGETWVKKVKPVQGHQGGQALG